MEESCANRQYLAWVPISIVVLFLLFYHPGSPMVFFGFLVLQIDFSMRERVILNKGGIFLFLNLTCDEYCWSFLST